MPKADLQRRTPTPDPNRRSAPRLPCPDPSPVRLLILPGRPPVWGVTHDISTTGLGLLLTRPVEIGTVLTLELDSGEDGNTSTLMAQVVHATPFPKGGWLVGCHLSRPLREDEM